MQRYSIITKKSLPLFAEVSSLDKGKNKFLSIMEHWQLILYYWNIPIAILYFS
nr:MAG TPA: hypothetical protein [Caudoviricetes sp.]